MDAFHGVESLPRARHACVCVDPIVYARRSPHARPNLYSHSRDRVAHPYGNIQVHRIKVHGFSDREVRPERKQQWCRRSPR